MTKTIQKSLMGNLVNSFAGRTMLQSFGLLTPGKEIEPFFAFRVGKYQDDNYLYFPKQPSTTQYHNFVFNRVCLEYNNGTVEDFFRFHFDQYECKTRFLKYLSWLMGFKRENVSRSKLPAINFCIRWQEEKMLQLIADEEKKAAGPALETEVNLNPVDEKVAELIKALPEKLDPVEKKISDLVNNLNLYKNSIPEELEPLKGKIADLVDTMEEYRKSLPKRLEKIESKISDLMAGFDKYGNIFADKLQPVDSKLNDLMTGIDNYKNSLPEKLFPKIKLLNPEAHGEKLIHLYFMLSNIIINGKPVFKMNDSDIKQLLPLIYADFDAPYNTVKKKVENAKTAFGDCTTQDNYENLENALLKFFS